MSRAKQDTEARRVRASSFGLAIALALSFLRQRFHVPLTDK
jgi:hypothetical protein